jgi:hypothetical protein
MPNKMTPDDISAGLQMAQSDFASVMDEVRELGRGSRIRILEEKDREEFFKEITKDEELILKGVAENMGATGMAAFERIMQDRNRYK